MSRRGRHRGEGKNGPELNKSVVELSKVQDGRMFCTQRYTNPPLAHGEVVLEVRVSSVAKDVHLVEDVAHFILGDHMGAVLLQELIH